MVSCLSDACSVVSDGVEWFQLLSGGEDGVGGGGGGSVIFNLQLCIYSVASFFKETNYVSNSFTPSFFNILLVLSNP